ncbi:ABC-type glycerol-3-phosphate transport system, substrate-binding protein [Pseudobutyrivibrio sp. 49]|uniref:ABC transporter substrate-binding protein n=1 Tax=unclassified Pseudobutyrivibrio TaxID=2638619 RepID=UPI0008900AC9|nr:MULTISPECIES: ABC transporter substrate-binding protein [unclassified Pseudobutyrivibrio]SDH90089.1 ABC-type glycerol-3-phosphate transport system, substrate-binding protein [Pseudobutyrivibrio sp. 49]SFO19704.1 ABC-type glycerol-3-phosphate transport system, substrate-binding protein [Pseudobutyrivibrio sp. UC1225]
MKKRIVSLLVLATMTATMFAGCGGSDSATTEAPADSAATETADAEVAAELPADTGKVLNIQCWNDEFQSRLKSHYPGYEEVDATHGKIGDVEVVWTITPSTDNAYQNNLDEALLAQESAAADDKVDLFLVEADYALKYVDTDYAMALSDLGITDADLADQYKYTQSIVTDSNGKLKGSSWQACSAGLIYNREAAKEVLGTDDPDEVQAAVADWGKYNETAAKVAEAGYTMCSAYDTFRVYSNNVSGKWVQDNKVVIDKNIDKWIDDSKELVDAKAEDTDDLWGDDWAKGKNPEGKVFCYFGPAWFFNFCLNADDPASIAGQGGWGYCVGPQSYYWGGTWICAATGTDNANLVKDIILKMTTDKGILKDIAQQDADCVNSKTVLAELAADDSGNLDLLGGQNPYKQLAEGAEKVDLSNISAYDQGCNEELQKAIKNYFQGNATKEEALDMFKKAVVEKYPELTAE